MSVSWLDLDEGISYLYRPVGLISSSITVRFASSVTIWLIGFIWFVGLGGFVGFVGFFRFVWLIASISPAIWLREGDTK